MSKCANCNELVGEEWSANNGLCTTCARDEMSKADAKQPDHIVDMHEMVTDTNQASEDGLRTLDEILSQALTDGASDTMWQDERHIEIFATAKKELLAIIRTEKLKLLAEVRERVVGEDEGLVEVTKRNLVTASHFNAVIKSRNQLRETIRNKLKEAEL